MSDSLPVAHQVGEALEEVVRIAWSGRSFRVVLHREHRPVVERDAAVGIVEQRDVGLCHVVRQRGLVHREAVIHRGNLDLAGGDVFHRVVGAMVALVHLHGLAADGEAEHLMAEADAESRQARLDHLLDHRDRVFTGRGRIARAVRQEDAVRLHGQDILGRRRGRHHGDLAALAGQQPQDIALDAVVDGDHIELGLVLPPIALLPLPGGFVPGEALAAGYHRHQVHADQSGPFAGFFFQGPQIEAAVWRMRDHRVRHALAADQCRERASVDAAETDDTAGFQPLVEMLGGPVIRRIGDRGAQDDATGARRCRHVQRLDVLVVGADIADMGEGECDDLPGIRWIGEDLLVAGHRGVEADFTDGGAFRAESEAFQHGAIGEHKERGRFEVRPGGSVF